MPKIHSQATRGRVIGLYESSQITGVRLTHLQIANRVGVSQCTVSLWIRAYNSDPEHKVPAPQTKILGQNAKKHSNGNVQTIRRTIMRLPFITMKLLQAKNNRDLGHLSIRTLNRITAVTLKMPAMRAAKKPCLTPRMINDR